MRTVGTILITAVVAAGLTSCSSAAPGTPAGAAKSVPTAGAALAACTVDGVTHRRSAVCPHMHGIVNWNSAEQTWDCPLHGARYTATGRVLEGPVTKDLSPA